MCTEQQVFGTAFLKLFKENFQPLNTIGAMKYTGECVDNSTFNIGIICIIANGQPRPSNSFESGSKPEGCQTIHDVMYYCIGNTTPCKTFSTSMVSTNRACWYTRPHFGRKKYNRIWCALYAQMAMRFSKESLRTSYSIMSVVWSHGMPEAFVLMAVLLHLGVDKATIVAGDNGQKQW